SRSPTSRSPSRFRSTRPPSCSAAPRRANRAFGRSARSAPTPARHAPPKKKPPPRNQLRENQRAAGNLRRPAAGRRKPEAAAGAIEKSRIENQEFALSFSKFGSSDVWRMVRRPRPDVRFLDSSFLILIFPGEEML